MITRRSRNPTDPGPAGSLLALALALAASGCGAPVELEERWQAMGTVADVRVVMADEPDAQEAIDGIRDRIAEGEIDLLPEGPGELGLLNKVAQHDWYEVGQRDNFSCLLLALDYAKESGGSYDPTLGPLLSQWRTRLAAGQPPRPAELELTRARTGWRSVDTDEEQRAVRFRAPGMQLDLQEVARGCALDFAARTFARPGSVGGVLRLGDTYRVWGRPPDADGWEVVVHDPRDPERPLVTLRLSDRSLGVAGHREIGGPGNLGPLGERLILDPATGQPAAGDLLLVMTLASSAADAAALTQAVFVAGSLRGGEFLSRTRKTEALLLVRRDGDRPYLLASASLEGRIRLSDPLLEETRGEVRYLLASSD